MRRRTLRQWLATLHITPEERHATCAESCMEVLYDSERASGSHVLGEHQEAVIEAERRRWSSMHDPTPQP